MKVVGTEKDYKDLIKAISYLDDEDFPIVLGREDPLDVTMLDVKDFFDHFKKDTGLDVSIHIRTCDDCSKMHMVMTIDKREEHNFGKLHLMQ